MGRIITCDDHDVTFVVELRAEKDCVDPVAMTVSGLIEVLEI